MGEEAVTDLAVMSVVGLLCWLMGFLEFSRSHPITVPIWISILCGKGRRRTVYIRPLALQLLGLLSTGWAMVLALLVASHTQRVQWFSYGFFVFLLLAALLVIIKQVRR